MDAHEQPVDIDRELRVATRASLWLIRHDRYLRLPRREAPRPPTVSPALADGTWHRHNGVWKVTDAAGTHYRILPSDRPAGAQGVYTGDVVAEGEVTGDVPSGPWPHLGEP